MSLGLLLHRVSKGGVPLRKSCPSSCPPELVSKRDGPPGASCPSTQHSRSSRCEEPQIPAAGAKLL
eukprot:1157719-Pelagomonas_calceolata.AAC.5